MENRKIFPPRKQKQKPLGPAPIASFENTSTDELKYEVKIILLSPPIAIFTNAFPPFTSSIGFRIENRHIENHIAMITVDAAIQLEWK